MHFLTSITDKRASLPSVAAAPRVVYNLHDPIRKSLLDISKENIDKWIPPPVPTAASLIINPLHRVHTLHNFRELQALVEARHKE